MVVFFSIFFGYIDIPLRQYFKYYFLISLLLLLVPFAPPVYCGVDSEWTPIICCFMPLPGTSIISFISVLPFIKLNQTLAAIFCTSNDINGNILLFATSFILAFVEASIMSMFHLLGRFLGNKLGNIHQL